MSQNKQINQSITKEFLKSFLDKYTYNPISNISARWAIFWCILFMFLGDIHMYFYNNQAISFTIDCIFGVMVILLYPTLGATGTLHRRREETIKSYSKNLEKLVAEKTKLLSKSEEKYRTLFEMVPAGMFRVNENLEIVDINNYALHLLGLPYLKVKGKKCKDIICENKENMCRGITSKEIALHSSSGEQNFVVISCRNTEIDGRMNIIGNITTINEIKKLETTILEHKLKLESIFDGMEDGIIAIDKELKIAAINRKQASILNSTPDEIIGKPCGEILHPECTEISKRVFLTGQKERKEIILHDQKGNEIYEDIIYAPIKNKEGEVVQVIEVLRDITEKKQMENLLIRSERLASMGEIAACVSHEINNPIGIILGFSQRLLKRVPANSLEYEELKIIEQECIRCGKIIKGLLAFAKPGIPQKQLTTMEDIISTSLKLIELKLNKQGIQVQRTMSQDSKIEIDPHQIQQVLMNIFINAIQAMPKGGHINISIWNQDQTFDFPNGCNVIEIKDTGAGIPDENRHRVFEPFFSTKSNGSGLGLSLSKRIIDAHSGSLEIDSEIEKGTRVMIKLPL